MFLDSRIIAIAMWMFTVGMARASRSAANKTRSARMTASIEKRVDYYRNRDVRARIVEFLGGDVLENPTCSYLVGGDMDQPQLRHHYGVRALGSFFDGGLEICRSLWDETSLLADFDVEYVNFDHAAEAFLEPERVFKIQEPVAATIERTLHEYGVSALHLLSGRGHHFVWRIQRDSEAFGHLVKLGRGPQSLWKAGREPQLPEEKGFPVELARAFAGLGLVMEFLAHRIKEIAAPITQIPVELTAVEVGPSEHGREMVSIDISEYGDPLYSRMLRAPFGVYLKPWQQRWAFGAQLLKNLSPLVVVPLEKITWREGILRMRDFAAAQELAQHSITKIPDAGENMQKLIGDYEGSNVAKFHEWFYSQEPHPPDRWPETYDQLPLEILPACARGILERPNDLLLRPAPIRGLVRVMLALGWHPRHIAGLITSRYARPFGWTQFEGCDPATRADFYTRVFAGLFATGRDNLVDFNCVSAQEQKTCPFSNCGFNLLEFQQSALDRRAHDRLAHRPFNRLFLSSKHS
jgi:hypothetical protein